MKECIKGIKKKAVTGSLIISMLASGLSISGCAARRDKPMSISDRGTAVEVFRSQKFGDEDMYHAARQDWMKAWVENSKGIYHFESDVLPNIMALYSVAGRTIGYYVVFAGVRNAKDKGQNIDDFLLYTPDIIRMNGVDIDVAAIKERVGSLVSANTDAAKGAKVAEGPAVEVMAAAISAGESFPVFGGYKMWQNDCYDAVVRLAILKDLGLKFNSASDVSDALYVLSFEWIFARGKATGSDDSDNLLDIYKKKLASFRQILNQGNAKAKALYGYLAPEQIVSISDKKSLESFLGGLKKAYPNWWYPSINEMQVKIEDVGVKPRGVVTLETYNPSQLQEGDIVMVEDSPLSENSHWGILVNYNGWKVLNANGNVYVLTSLNYFIKDTGFIFLYR